MTLASLIKEHRTARGKSAKSPVEPIGEPGGTVRVLNFAGGGFDTVMQLGVTHALLVNQGKAPDVVVGVSAGAIEAAALAEVMRAGIPDAKGISREHYREVLGRRVARFRQFSDACHNAPESVVDAVLPDAYQIDSFEPLASLRLPRLSAEEREERDDWIATKTGLVRLYNDLLSIDLSFGVVTRLVRRWLGMKAASALSSRPRRWILSTVEFMRLWLVCGTELDRLTPIVPIVMRPLVPEKGGMRRDKVRKERPVRHYTAGSIMFKFRPVESFHRFVRNLWSFLFLLRLWVVLSWAAVLSPFLLAAYFGDDDLFTEYLVVFSIFYLLPFVLPLTPISLAYDRTRFRTALKDLNKGLFAFLYYLLKWTLVLLMLLAGLLLALLMLLAGLVSLPHLISPLVSVSQGLPGLEGLINGTGVASDRVLQITFLVGMTILLVIWGRLARIFRAIISYFWGRRRQKVSGKRWYVRRFLDSYGLGPALAHNYNLKRLLVGLFDSAYYGRVDMKKVLKESSKDGETLGYSPPLKPERRRLSSYTSKRSPRDPKIFVAPTAADVRTGKMIVMNQETPVVDALLASTAITPVLPPVKIDNRLLIDAYRVGNAPTKALVELFKEVGLADVDAVHIYAVDPLPISQEHLGTSAQVRDFRYVNLIDIVMRALQLQRFRDANIERRLTDIISKTLPEKQGTLTVDGESKPRTYFRARFVPVELDQVPNLNRKLLFREKSDRRRAISETIAAGCRTSLQVMHARVLDDIAEKNHKARENGFVKCSVVMKEVARQRNTSIGYVPLPGSDGTGPGLAEVCKHCWLSDPSSDSIHKVAKQSLSLRKQSEKAEADRESEKILDWPHELDDRPARRRASSVRSTPKKKAKGNDDKKNTGKGRPAIACLFSGGVFRGVFQLGTLNALNLLGVRPNIVAGASVGSITAAMVASALAKSDDNEKKLTVAKLASAYLSIDRIILTDRFADFVRNWTIRASETRFSLRQMDRVFRKYDEPSGKDVQRDVRQVMAGIERLFYINPYQVNRITRAIRNRNGDEASQLMKDGVQHWLDRLEVGEEVLGAEPIRLLIEEFVIPARYRDKPWAAPFDCIDEKLVFLATATNLKRGCLRILSSKDEFLETEKNLGGVCGRNLGSKDEEERTTLIEGLLASSAFPGVFRPRRSWDLLPGTTEIDQFIDGGVMDNLPLDSVLQTMHAMAKSDKTKLPLRSEKGPHLMLAASLEVDTSSSDVDLETLARYWPEMRTRAMELNYNTKLHAFERVADILQDIHRHASAQEVPMRVKVLAVKPRWLCNTFAFHPMLGFRRIKQVESIAHGCAATLLAFNQVKEYAPAWRLRTGAIPRTSSFEQALSGLQKPDRARIKAGKCWLADLACPFSERELISYGAGALHEDTRKWLSRIHRCCWKTTTHVP